MLILSRKKGQSIMISDDIELVVVSMEGDQVKIGIRAPSNIKVHRKEIYDSIQESNIQSITTAEQLKSLKGMTDQVLLNWQKEK